MPKHSLTAMAQKEVCPRDEIAEPPGANVFPIGRHGFAEGFVYSRTLSGVSPAAERFARNRVGSSAVQSQGRKGEKPCVSCLLRSELSAQVRQHNSYIYYSQEYGKYVLMAPRP